MNAIIAPTDFSFTSLHAVNYATDLAASINADLVLVNIIEMPVIVPESPLLKTEPEEFTSTAEASLTNLKAELLSRTRNKIKIRTEIVVGSIEHELNEISHQNEALAVVMATNATRLLETFLLGSYTIFAINHLKYPILIVPPNASFNGIKKIALALDLKEIESEKTMGYLKKWLQPLNAKIDIINVTEQSIIHRAAPGAVSLQHELLDFDPQFYLIEKENVEQGIEQYVKENNPDLFLMIPREHGFFYSLFHRSVSKHFILHSLIPVLAISEK